MGEIDASKQPGGARAPANSMDTSQLQGFNREEFVAMAGIGQAQGHIDDRESQTIRNLFLFK